MAPCKTAYHPARAISPTAHLQACLWYCFYCSARDSATQRLLHQVDAIGRRFGGFWLQLFGQECERLAPPPDATQMHLDERMPLPTAPAAQLLRTVPAQTWRITKRRLSIECDMTPYFDASREPVQAVQAPDAATAGVAAD